MKFNETELPSNRKLGFFFTFVFALASLYFYWKYDLILIIGFAALALLFLIITLIRDSLLLPLNKLWAMLGLLLGIIISPVVLGVLFFGLFTPIAIIMRLFGRDELRLKQKEYKSFWIIRDDEENYINSFELQF